MFKKQVCEQKKGLYVRGGALLPELNAKVQKVHKNGVFCHSQTAFN
jgi:hypothetical protein